MGLPFHPQPKRSFPRSAPTRATQGKFGAKTIKSITERDNSLCVRCGSPYIESVPHHILFRSQGGLGTVDNGATICRPCHNLAHSTREVREWFEQYRLLNLLEELK